MLPLLSTFILSLAFVDALSFPPNNGNGATTINLTRRKHIDRRSLSPAEVAKLAQSHRKHIANKYAGHQHHKDSEKRATAGGFPLVNQNADVSYYGVLQAGTPPVQYSIVLDTGSSDLWLASSTCLQGCSAITKTYDTSKSSTAKQANQPFSIKYGSGAVAGNVVQDTISMAGFNIPNQIFGAVTQLSTGVISGSLSGLMGLAFAPLSQTGSTPFTEALSKANQLTDPLMSFYLTRFIDNPAAQAEEYGGQFNLGATNSSLFTGDIEYHNMPSGTNAYWAIPISQISVAGTRYGIPSNLASAAIDTGTTLIAGPSDAVAQIYGGIKGSVKGTGELEGFWTYPCNSKVQLTMNFGGKDWPISEADFLFGQATSTTCVGAIFEIPISGNVIQWIVGDTFLKNVYSVFRFSPPSIGFAQLAPSVGGSVAPTTGGAGGAPSTSRGLSTLSNDLPPGVGPTSSSSGGLALPTPNSAPASMRVGMVAAVVPALAMMLL